MFPPIVFPFLLVFGLLFIFELIVMSLMVLESYGMVKIPQFLLGHIESVKRELNLETLISSIRLIIGITAMNIYLDCYIPACITAAAGILTLIKCGVAYLIKNRFNANDNNAPTHPAY